MKVQIGDILQVLIGLDQVTASVSRLVESVRDTLDAQDEASLRTQLAALRKRNDARFQAVEDLLQKRAEGGK